MYYNFTHQNYDSPLLSPASAAAAKKAAAAEAKKSAPSSAEDKKGEVQWRNASFSRCSTVAYDSVVSIFFILLAAADAKKAEIAAQKEADGKFSLK